MYEVLENQERISTRKEVKERFGSKWVLMAHCEFGEGDEFLGGVPVVVSDGISDPSFNQEHFLSVSRNMSEYGEVLILDFRDVPKFHPRSWVE